MKDEDEPAPTVEEIMRRHQKRMEEFERKWREWKESFLRREEEDKLKWAADVADRKRRSEELWAYVRSVVEKLAKRHQREDRPR
jgi:hypothetical protein